MRTKVRRTKGAHLWLRREERNPDGTLKRRALWYIRDGLLKVNTRCPQEFRQGAERALNEYIDKKYLHLRTRKASRLSPTKPSYVYFVSVGDRVKIGVSTAPGKRITSVAESVPDQMVSAVITRGSWADEQRLHSEFAASRINGEWFLASEELKLTIARCAIAGSVEIGVAK